MILDGSRTIRLPKPNPGRAGTVFAALKKRRTNRSISDRKLSDQLLSNLLWSACGVNRKQGPFDGTRGRTAASASNSQEIELYVALADGTYRYDASLHALALLTEEDVRRYAIGKGQEPAGAQAPVRLIYVANLEKYKTAGFQEPGLKDPEVQKSYYYADTGMIAANVYLFASSEGLAAWFHNCNKPKLAEKLELGSTQRVLFGQSVGHPASNRATAI